MAFRGIKVDPIRNFKFEVNFPSATGGTSRAGFSRVSGLKETTEPVDYREGTEPGRPRKLFGQVSFDNIILERGLTTDTEMISWRRLITDVVNNQGAFTPEGQAVVGNDFLRRNVDILLGDFHGEASVGAAWAWQAVESWPTSLEIGEFAGDGNDVILETVELVHEGLEVISNG